MLSYSFLHVRLETTHSTALLPGEHNRITHLIIKNVRVEENDSRSSRPHDDRFAESTLNSTSRFKTNNH